MNILWISLYPPLPLNYGGPIGIYKRLVELAKYNKIYMFYMDNELKEEYDKALMLLCKEVHAYKRVFNLFTCFKMIASPYTAITRSSRQMQKDIEKCCHDNKIDLINIEFPQMYVNVDKIDTGNIPIVIHEHNNEWDRFMQMSVAAHGLRSFLYKWESKKLYRYERKIEKKGRVSQYSFLSKDDEERFQERFGVSPSRTFLVPLGADEVKTQPIAHKGKNLVFFAAIDSEMNEEAALWFAKDIFPKIQEKIENVKYYIVGRDPSEKILKLASSDIIVTGTVDSLEPYYGIADVVVIPLLHGGGVKVKLLEAVGHKMVIVTTAVGIEGTTFSPNEHILVANDPQSFADKCIKAMIDEDYSANIITRMGQHFAENYQWKTIGKAYQTKLEKIAEIE